jgi:hypothetical protein
MCVWGFDLVVYTGLDRKAHIAESLRHLYTTLSGAVDGVSFVSHSFGTNGL